MANYYRTSTIGNFAEPVKGTPAPAPILYSKADLIKMIRKRNPRAKQRAIAEAVGVSEAYVSRILNQ